MANDDLRFMPAADLAAAIARRKVSPVDAVKAVLDAIDDTKTLNAWVTVDADAALKAARATERAAMPPRKIARHGSHGDAQDGFVASTRQPSSRNTRAALAVASRTSGSTAGARPRVSLYATRSPLSDPLSAFT